MCRCDSRFEDTTPIDTEGYRDVLIVAFDAINYRVRPHVQEKEIRKQYSEHHILRDIKKVFNCLNE